MEKDLFREWLVNETAEITGRNDERENALNECLSKYDELTKPIFEVGDIIRVKPEITKRPSYWAFEMDYFLGGKTEAKIICVEPDGIMTEQGNGYYGWYLRFEDIELVRKGNGNGK